MTTMEEYFKKSSTRDLLRRKLQEVISEGTQVCDNLVDYICLLCMNKMTDNEQDAKKTFREDLNAFFGAENSEIFTAWIWKHMRRFREADQEIVQADFPSVSDRKSTTRRDRNRRDKSRNRHKRSRSRSRNRDQSRKHTRTRSSSTERSRRRERVIPQKKRATPKKRERSLFNTVLKEIQAGSRSGKLTSYGGRVKPPAEPMRITTEFVTLPLTRSSKGGITVKHSDEKLKKSKRKIMLESGTRRQRKVLLDSKEEVTNSAIEDMLVNEIPAQRDIGTPAGEQTENDAVTVKEEDEKGEVSPLLKAADPEFVISFSGEGSRANKAQHKRRFIIEESIGKMLAKQETNAALVIEDPTLLTGPDSTICWDYFSIIGCQRTPCKWRHELPENRNVKLEVIDMNLLQPVLKYSEMLLQKIGWQRGRGYRGRGRSRGWTASRRGRGRGRGTKRVFPNISWTAEDENSILESEGGVPAPCFFDPVCERIGCHFQHPKRTARAKKFLESSKDESNNGAVKK